MQLTDSGQPEGAPRGLRLSPFARTLLTLCVCTAPVLGGVLPEDRADVMYHYYNGGDITVEGPSVLIRKKAGDNLSFTANYYEDMISSASIDVKLSASPYHETRKQWSGGVEYLHGKSTYSAGIITSKEPDYKANTMFYNVSQDMFGDLTTITLGYRRGWDQIYRDIKENGEIINDPTFHERADHRGYSFALSQILTRNLIANFNYELLTDQGYLQNPYRQIRYSSPGVGNGFTLANQVYPDTRTSNAASISFKYYLQWRASITAQYRYFRDTWDIVANTFELDYTHGWHNWIFDGTLRFYHQTPANFYSDRATGLVGIRQAVVSPLTMDSTAGEELLCSIPFAPSGATSDRGMVSTKMEEGISCNRCILHFAGPLHSDSSLALSGGYHRRSDCGRSCHRHNFFFGLGCGK